MTTTHINVSHEAVCPDISPVHCEELGGLPPHSHHQGITMTRLNTTLSYGLGRGWLGTLEVPFDFKRMRIEYQDANGDDYDPPYAGIHHRNEDLIGPGDPRWRVSHFAQVADGWVIGGGLGTTIPIGKTYPNPYELANESKEHQHIQMGSGTFDPMLNASTIWTGHRWGMMSNATLRLPLYANRHGYKPIRSMRLNIGPTWRVMSKLTLVLTTDFLTESAAYWGNRKDPMSGRTTVGNALGLIYRFSPVVALMGQGQLTWVQWSQADQIKQPFIGVLGFSITPKKKEAR